MILMLSMPPLSGVEHDIDMEVKINFCKGARLKVPVLGWLCTWTMLFVSSSWWRRTAALNPWVGPFFYMSFSLICDKGWLIYGLTTDLKEALLRKQPKVLFLFFYFAFFIYLFFVCCMTFSSLVFSCLYIFILTAMSNPSVGKWTILHVLYFNLGICVACRCMFTFAFRVKICI